VSGDDDDSTLVDFHNHAHRHVPISYIIEGTRVSASGSEYSTYRVYNLSQQ